MLWIVLLYFRIFDRTVAHGKFTLPLVRHLPENKHAVGQCRCPIHQISRFEQSITQHIISTPFLWQIVRRKCWDGPTNCCSEAFSGLAMVVLQPVDEAKVNTGVEFCL